MARQSSLVLIVTLLAAPCRAPAACAEDSAMMSADDREGATEAVDFQKEVFPLLKKYCVDCHGVTKKKAGLALDIYEDKDPAAARMDREIWEKVSERLESHEMPPENRPQPSKE